MTKRDVIKLVLEGKRPPYVPWSYWFTIEGQEKLADHYGSDDIIGAVDNHLLDVGNEIGVFPETGDTWARDIFGVLWDRSIDRDIGNPRPVLHEASLRGYVFPDPLDSRFYADTPLQIERYLDCFRVFQLGFTLFERAWALRGMENLLVDFCQHTRFVEELFTTITDFTIAQIHKALTYDIDGFYFGDDWGQQHGLIMGKPLWRRFIYPGLRRMFWEVRDAGKYVFLHSCGDVDQLFDDLIEIGLDCFNPFQPDVMDVGALLKRYRGRLAFHGGLSLQRTLPSGTADDVEREVGTLIELGRDGGYILSPSHAVGGDVPLENMLAFIDRAKGQEGYEG